MYLECFASALWPMTCALFIVLSGTRYKIWCQTLFRFTCNGEARWNRFWISTCGIGFIGVLSL